MTTIEIPAPLLVVALAFVILDFFGSLFMFFYACWRRRKR